MTASLLDGNAFLNHVKADLHARALALGERGIAPGLATVLVGEDLNSAAYVRMKHEDCAEIGINSFREDLPATSTQADVIAAINRCNVNPEIDGFIVQLPLPNGLNDEAALMAIDPSKDADGLHPVNLGRLVMGSNAPIPCTPAGIQALLAFNGVEIEGKHYVDGALKKTLHATVALDEGAILAGEGPQQRCEAVCELEIELLSGAPQAVILAADAWVARFGLWLDTQTKAHRGDRLARQVLPMPDRPVAPASPPDTPPTPWPIALESALGRYTRAMSALASPSGPLLFQPGPLALHLEQLGIMHPQRHQHRLPRKVYRLVVRVCNGVVHHV